MIVEELFLSPTSKIAEDYLKEDENVLALFDYHFLEHKVFEKRKTELETRTFKREKLAEVITQFHFELGMNQQAQKQIDKIIDQRSLFVVGGQQPGLLTGPLFSIYKAITIIKLAREQELKLGVPVIPLFWIAGEDHDLAEVNHVFIEIKNKTWEKKPVDTNSIPNKPLTTQILGPEIEQWIEEVFSSFKETEHTKELYTKVKSLLKYSDTYVNFFARLMNWLFEEEGLLLLDAGDNRFRQLQKDTFSEIIIKNEELHQKFLEQTELLESLGYETPIEKSISNANLFLIQAGIRQRLDREDSKFKTKTSFFTKDVLLTIAQTRPHDLSNNVVTRPLMQEKMLPVLAFVAGPGEIAYWSTLQKMFHHVGIKIPPIVPRLSATIVNRQTKKYLEECNINIKDVLTVGIENAKEQWFETVEKWDIMDKSNQVINEMNKSHQDLRDLAAKIEPSFERLAKKNFQYIERQIRYIESKLLTKVKDKHSVELSKFDSIGHWLTPLNRRQERFFHVFFLLNLYGVDLLKEILVQEISENINHKLFYI